MQLHRRHPHQHLRQARQLPPGELPRHPRSHPPWFQLQEGGQILRHLGQRQAPSPVHLLHRPSEAHDLDAQVLRRGGPYHPLRRRGGRGAHLRRCVRRGQVPRRQHRRYPPGGHLRHLQGGRAVQEDGQQPEAQEVPPRLQVHPLRRGDGHHRQVVPRELRDRWREEVSKSCKFQPAKIL